jgi:GntR family transcriptional regulator
MLNRHSPLPLYHQLAESLLAAIRSGTWAEGEKIPSENALAAEHGIGRPTVRQAVDSLVRQGVLVRRRGAGTFVAPRREAVDLFSLSGTMQSFRDTGRAPQMRVLAGPVLRAVDNGGPGDLANPFAGGRAVVFSRLSRMDDAPVLVEDIYLDPALFPGMEELDLTDASLSRVAEERYGLVPTAGEQHFRIAYPDARLARLLGLGRTTPILAVGRYLDFSRAARGVFSSLYCRTDRFVFTQKIGGLHG